MRSFSGNRNGFGSGETHEITAKIQEVKAAPNTGQKRLIVRENGKTHTHTVIDIDMKHMRELEEKATYKFQVKEKELGRPGQSQRSYTSGLKSYECRDTPELYDAEKARQEKFSRFGRSSTSGSHTRF